jgi:hypothetical protein
MGISMLGCLVRVRVTCSGLDLCSGALKLVSVAVFVWIEICRGTDRSTEERFS